MTPCAMSCKAHYVDLAGAAAVLSMYEGMILTGAWWDVVDAIVRRYVRTNAKKLSPLSVREALKKYGIRSGLSTDTSNRPNPPWVPCCTIRLPFNRMLP